MLRAAAFSRSDRGQSRSLLEHGNLVNDCCRVLRYGFNDMQKFKGSVELVCEEACNRNGKIRMCREVDRQEDPLNGFWARRAVVTHDIHRTQARSDNPFGGASEKCPLQPSVALASDYNDIRLSRFGLSTFDT